MTVKCKRARVAFSASAVLIAIFALWIIWGNTALEVNRYAVSSDKIPDEFHRYRIAHISDLHNTEIGKDNERLISALAEAEPDIIAVTGDLVDSRNTDIEIAVSFMEKAVEIAPCYYVTGNHEARIAEYEELNKKLIAIGVVVLDNKRVEVEKNGKSISLVGTDDPGFEADYLFDDEESVIKRHLQELFDGNSGYSVLLSHRPELFKVYSESGADLILSGHAHGGQFRLPLVGGVFAPQQGFFPEYDGGIYNDGKINMVVSRGIGNSIFPFRGNNRPEIVLIELYANTD